MAKLLIRLLLFAVLCIGAQWVMGHFYRADFGPSFEFPARLTALKPDRPNVVYFGDSVIASTAPNEPDREGVITKFKALTPEANTAACDYSATGTPVQAEFCRYMQKHHIEPDVLIVPLNLRAFSFEWALNPGFQQAPARIRLEYDDVLPQAFYQPLCVLRWFNTTPITQEDYARAAAAYRRSRVEVLKPLTPIQQEFLRCYDYVLTKEDSSVKALGEILSRYKGSRTKVLIYVTPIDTAWGTRELGPVFQKPVAANIQFLRDYCTQNGAVWLDLHDRLDSDAFVWQMEGHATEHLNSRGRAFVAEQVSTVFKSMMTSK